MQNNSLIDANDVSKYLSEKYGEIYKENMDFQWVFKEAVKRDHSIDELKQMIKRLEYGMLASKDKSYLNTVPFTIYTSILTSLTTVIVSFFTFFYSTANAFSNMAVTKDNDGKINPSDLLNAITEGGGEIVRLIIYSITIMFFSMMTLWIIIDKKHSNYYFRQYGYKLLLEEALSEFEKEGNNYELIF
ncbi:hypothetical protein [Bacillus atrophaeus]|uniref:hypothetical protein n=1 Tax=Bacillus atrophaeus TaxID=1452 RepID=UPI0022820885|nr:hypothetical protein [Bacillus atrophaeus]MCY8915642.1 hypothetical protein [Bacillus atrophaeus]MCY8924318.1 hypothetical protein [Bacillus atrophaeus]MCY8975646.1 hypothetical protein [Bacillus atrophaeus]